jgi:hypothetical protein
MKFGWPLHFCLQASEFQQQLVAAGLERQRLENRAAILADELKQARAFRVKVCCVRSVCKFVQPLQAWFLPD